MKSTEEQIKTLLARHSFPPLGVVIPILEKAGQGEKELACQIHDTYASLANGLTQILDLKDRNMKTLAKMYEIILGHEGAKFEPIELSESRFSFTVSDCPMMHVGRNVGTQAKSKFCDLICGAAAEALVTTTVGSESVCSWDKALIKGTGKCKVSFTSGKKK